MENIITYVAMDTHKKEHKVALHYPGDEQIIQFVVKNTAAEPYHQIVGLLCCFHGIDTLTAITTITEIFEFGRFSSPNELMSYLGQRLRVQR